MADIYPPIHPHQIDFGFHQHAPPSLSFAFGLHPQQHTSYSSPAPSTPTHLPARNAKRRLADDEGEDDRMDARSPTPESRRFVPLKRARATTSSKEDRSAKDESPEDSQDSQPDVGVMLAMLPQQSLMPLLVSLVKSRPDIKSTLLSLMPRPSLESALETLNQAASRLRDAHPYSSGTSHTVPQSKPTFGHGFGFGFGSAPSPRAVSPPYSSHASTSKEGNMRTSYIHSRLGPHLNDFVTTVTSSLPFFSMQAPSEPSTSTTPRHPRPHPSESFSYLAGVCRIILSFPPSTQAALEPMIASRLMHEWRVWAERVDEVVNRERGMFGHGQLASWDAELSGLGQKAGSSQSGLQRLKEVHERWIAKVGWLLGRTAGQGMEGSGMGYF